MQNNKIAIIGTVGIPAKYGGFETLTEYLTEHLGCTLDLTVFCSSKAYPDKPHTYNNATLVYISLNPNGIQSIFYDIVSMLKALKLSDTLLILGVSGCIALPLIRLISRKKVIVNIDGLEWKRAKWNRATKWFLKLSEMFAVKFSNTVIADNKIIKDYVMKEYGRHSMLIEYGGDHVKYLPLSTELKKAYHLTDKPYAFKVCRIEPENNIQIILEAFCQVDFPFLLVGNFSNSEYGRKIVKKYSTIKNIQLCDPIYDQDKLNQLRGNAAVYIHGHSAGGTNPSLVEAMNLGLPVVAFDVPYNRETTGDKALYFTTTGDLVHILQNEKNTFHKMRETLKDIALSRHCWRKITKQYEELLVDP